MADSAGEKTEPATPRKKRKAREEGQVARSQDLNNAVILMAAVIVLYFYGASLFTQMEQVTHRILSHLGQFHLALDNVVVLGQKAVLIMAMMILPILLVVGLFSLIVNLLQVGILFTAEPLSPKPNRLNPISGIKRIFSLRSLVKLAASIFKLLVIGTVLYVTLVDEIDNFFILLNQEPQQIISYIGATMYRLGFRTAIALLILALIDYSYQRWQHEQDLKMSKQEVKDEMKQMEGDPKVKARRRQIAIHLAQQRMMTSVPEADVVVTNPTHLAVALSYSDDMVAPKVVAKGADRLAARIREMAAAHSIPVVEKKELAQALYRTCDVGDSVPEDLWQAVAEVLAYVYQLGKSPAML